MCIFESEYETAAILAIWFYMYVRKNSCLRVMSIRSKKAHLNKNRTRKYHGWPEANGFSYCRYAALTTTLCHRKPGILCFYMHFTIDMPLLFYWYTDVFTCVVYVNTSLKTFKLIYRLIGRNLNFRLIFNYFVFNYITRTSEPVFFCNWN